jgi:hypothetical protein
LQLENIDINIPIEEDIIDKDEIYDYALVSEDYLELIKNYNITNQVYIISCDELLNSEVNTYNNIENVNVNQNEKSQDNTVGMEIDDYIEMKVNEILETNSCPECIKGIVYEIFYSGITTEKSIQLARLQEELGYLDGNDDNGDDYLN